MFRKIARSAVPLALIAAAGAALTACNPDDSTSASSSSSASASSSTGTGSSSTGTGSSGQSQSDQSSGQSSQNGSQPKGSGSTDTKSSAGAGKSATQLCQTNQLKITSQSMDSGAGSTHDQLVFQNTGSKPCTLSGYPGVSFVKAHNVQLGKAATRTKNAPVTTVTLIPNAHAYADLQTVNGQAGYDSSVCRLTTVPTLRIYPPSQKESYQIPWGKKECVGSSVQNLQVGPIHGNK